MTGNDRLVWVDMETTGLDPRLELPLEIGFIITNLNLDVIDQWDCMIWDTPTYDEKILDPFVLKMHGPEGSGLLEEAQEAGVTAAEAFAEGLDFLKGHGVVKAERIGTEPMVGSSVQFDREWLFVHAPEIFASFHYRNIDWSTVKELCRRYNPPVYAKIDRFTTKRELHRVLPDIEDSISEARFYIDNFLSHCIEGVSW